MYFVAPCSWSHSKPTPCTLQGSPAQDHPGDKAQLSLLQLSGKPGCENRAGTSGDCKVPGTFQLSPGSEHQGSSRMQQQQIPSCCTDEALTTPFTTRFWGISPKWDRNFSPNLLSHNLRISGGGRELLVGAGVLPCSCSLCSGRIYDPFPTFGFESCSFIWWVWILGILIHCSPPLGLNANKWILWTFKFFLPWQE